MSHVKFFVNLSKRACSNHITVSTQKHNVFSVGSLLKRSLSTMEITKNICLLTNEKKNVNITSLPDKTLVIMPAWLMAKRKHINKYAQLYLNRGFDVLSISMDPWQLLWPVRGSQMVAREILKFLDVNKTYSPLILHGFSIGGYLWGEVLVQIAAERSRYQPILDRFVGQVWDSAADITEISIGFPMAVFPNNNVLQNVLRSYTKYHMKTFYKVATIHYLRSSKLFHSNLMRAPALIFCSRTDPVGAVKSNQQLCEDWESAGIKVYWKCWEKSPHVGHMHAHPEEYVDELNRFLEKTGLLAPPNEIKAKL